MTCSASCARQGLRGRGPCGFPCSCWPHGLFWNLSCLATGPSWWRIALPVDSRGGLVLLGDGLAAAWESPRVVLELLLALPLLLSLSLLSLPLSLPLLLLLLLSFWTSSTFSARCGPASASARLYLKTLQPFSL
jgi:hypothetical protein